MAELSEMKEVSSFEFTKGDTTEEVATKRGRGRPRIHPIKEINPNARVGRPRIHPIKEVDPNKPKQIRHRPALDRSIYNKRYVDKNPGLYEKYGKKRAQCDLCNCELLSRNFKSHLQSNTHLANLFKKSTIIA